MNETVNGSVASLVTLAEPLDNNKVTPGVLGFLVFAAIGVAVWLLMKNMNKQFAKVNFEEEPEPGAEGSPARGSGASQAGAAAGPADGGAGRGGSD